MNAIGILLAGSIAHATAFAIAAMPGYFLIRRRGPAAGALAAGSSLAVMALVSIAALSPWPRWWTIGGAERPVAAAVDRGERPSEPAASVTAEATPAVAAPAIIEKPEIEQPSLLSLLMEELRKPDATRDAWTWREWLAAGFLVSLAMGVSRIGLGLVGIARLHARSRPVEDPDIDDLMAILRAEMGVIRRVEVREADELTTPATIGWRRPVVLLPPEWRSWDADERRAVLAHELAHVRRGDFPAGVVAQAALALHFYHPLAHWLSARLRLEQELAADAWGARLSGGKSSYLATLAQMALRRDGRAPTWPARAFLPSHGTFVRRIEMLKNHGPIRNVAMPVASRLMTVFAIIALGVVVVGLRGPAGDGPAMAQERPAEKPVAPEAHNLAFVPADAWMVVSLRPGPLLGRFDFAPLLDQKGVGPSVRDRFPWPPEDIEQVVMFWESGAKPQAMHRIAPLLPTPSGWILRTSKPSDAKAVLKKFVPPGSIPIEEMRYDGQVYFRVSSDGPVTVGFYAPDDRTLIVAEEITLRDLIADRGDPRPGHPWDEAWKKVAGGPVMIGLDTRWPRRMLAQSEPAADRAMMLKAQTFSPLYEKARSYAMSLDATKEAVSLDLAAEATSPEGAQGVAKTLQAILTLGENSLAGLDRGGSRGPDADSPDPAGWLIRAASLALKQSRVETNERFVRLHAESPVDLAEGIRLMVPVVTRAQAASRRTISVNHLKQIGLAFHNYHSTNNHFPASSNRDKGRFPYSWRVAILPYIEEQELYNQYRFDEPWDGPNNKKLIDRMPPVYAYPGLDGGPISRTTSSYFLFTGEHTIGGAKDGSKFQEIFDGTSNTILAVEARRDIPWTKPEDIPFDPTAPIPELGGYSPDGFDALFADGSVRFLKTSIKPHLLKALITRDGGEIIDTDQF